MNTAIVVRIGVAVRILVATIAACIAVACASNARNGAVADDAPKMVSLAVAPASASTCPSIPIDVQPINWLATEGADGASATCGSSTYLIGRAKAGDHCQSPIECEPTCCACARGGRAARAAWCHDGVCAPAGDVCCAVAGSTTRSCGG